MASETFILLIIATIVLLYGLVAFAAYFRMRGTRIVVCPETEELAAVNIDAGHAAFSAVREKADIELTSCSRWQGVPQCDQACTAQQHPAQLVHRQIVRDLPAGHSTRAQRRAAPRADERRLADPRATDLGGHPRG